jgi:N-acetylglucosamine-6-phosphate deacetylase
VPRRLLQPAALLDPEREAPVAGALLLDDGRIAGLLAPAEAARVEAERVDLSGAFLAPGFLDLHYHGGLVFPPLAAAGDALARSAAELARHGTTAFLATTVALPQPDLVTLVEALARRIDAGDLAGAQPIGIHLEGPWIDTRAAGAQPESGIRAVSLPEVDTLLAAAAGTARLVTFAPEVEGAAQLLETLARRGIVAAIGHSLAEAPTVERAVAGGARHVTHLFNAMGGLHHRERGVAGFALADDRLSCDLICDGAHVHPDVVRVAARAKGERLVLITDRVEAASGAPGTGAYGAGGLHDDGTAVRFADGRLAGSRLTLDCAARNFRAWTGASLVEAVAACTLRPARVLGCEAERGTLRRGARADLVALGADGAVRATLIGGQRVHDAYATAGPQRA